MERRRWKDHLKIERYSEVKLEAEAAEVLTVFAKGPPQRDANYC